MPATLVLFRVYNLRASSELHAIHKVTFFLPTQHRNGAIEAGKKPTLDAFVSGAGDVVSETCASNNGPIQKHSGEKSEIFVQKLHR